MNKPLLTLPELVERVKVLNQVESADQIEKFVLSLLGAPKRSDFIMMRLYRRQILERLKKSRG